MGEIDWGLQIWTLLTFAGLFFLLSKFAFGPIRKILLEREEKIASSIKAAEQARDHAEQTLKDNQAKLDAAREETRKIINEGHRIVSEMKKEASEQAKKTADLIVSRAQSDIDREVQKSLDGLKGTIANISVNISRQFLKETIDEQKHQELAEDFIERLKKRNVARR